MSNRDRHGDATDPESGAFASDQGLGVISGEAVPPDEHTRRVAALKKKKEGEKEQTLLTVHDETRTAVPAEPDPAQQRLQREARAARNSGARGGLSHDSPTDTAVPAAREDHPGPVRAYSGASPKPASPFGAPKAQVPKEDAKRPEPKLAASPPSTSASSSSSPTAPEGPSSASGSPAYSASGATATSSEPSPSSAPNSSAPADAAAGSAPPAPAAPAAEGTTPRTSELAERSNRQRRRDRDRRAERAAMRAVIFIFLGLGGLALWVVNSDWLNGPDESTAHTSPQTPPQKRLQKQVPTVTSGSLDETPDLPALRMLRDSGLTIAAEGLPEVVASEETPAASVLAAIETCRFAFGIWEFSPNHRFRFYNTCEGFEGQTMVGAYDVKGSKVSMSPLTDGPATISMVFEVEKPSTMTTQVNVTQNGRTILLGVSQRITTLRGGMHGEEFRDTYGPKNNVQLPGRKPAQGTDKAPGHDPLREMLQQRQH